MRCTDCQYAKETIPEQLKYVYCSKYMDEMAVWIEFELCPKEVEMGERGGGKMTNGDRIRTFSNEHLALVLMCPNDAVLDEIECLKESGKGCRKCIYDWLNAEEAGQ